MLYRVTWTIEVDADGPSEAACKARQFQSNDGTVATIYEVTEVYEGRLLVGRTFDVRGAPEHPNYRALTMAEAAVEDDAEEAAVADIDPDAFAGHPETAKPTSFRILWPEERTVEAEVIRGWYADAIANGEVVPGSLRIRDDVAGMANALSEAGKITLGRSFSALGEKG